MHTPFSGSNSPNEAWEQSFALSKNAAWASCTLSGFPFHVFNAAFFEK